MKKTIAHITDIHLDESFPKDRGVDTRENWNVILADIAKRQIDGILIGGDIGTQASNEWFFKSLNDYAERLKITLGNHDSYREVRKHLDNIPTEKKDEWYYYLDDPFYRYFFLDSSPGQMSVSQLEWLESELHNTGKKAMVYIHHPILSVDTPADRMFPLTNREHVKEVLLKHKQQVLLFCGHYHMEDETNVQNIRQYITPATSLQFVKKAKTLVVDTGIFGYRLIHHDKEGHIKTEVILFES